MSALDFQQIPYLGGPHDGEVTRMSDGVQMKLPGGYYEATYYRNKRVALWHDRPEEGL